MKPGKFLKHNRWSDPIPFDTGTVYHKSSGGYSVYDGEKRIVCTLSAQLKRVIDAPISVGDRVHYSPTAQGQGVIVDALPRRNQLARRTVTPKPTDYITAQVIAANVDQVVPVFSIADPAPHWNLLDRYLVSAEAAGIPVLICITKIDLLHEQEEGVADELPAILEEYCAIGYPAVQVSSRTGEGLDEVRSRLHGQVSVLVGKSGVGKTSLLNALQPGLGLRVNQVSQVRGKGRHTTSDLQMFPLDWGGAIVDTPGTREFGPWEVDEDDLALYFPEMRPFVGRCRFGLGCRHDEEPGCAVRRAVMEGFVSHRRYKSYMRLKEGL